MNRLLKSGKFLSAIIATLAGIIGIVFIMANHHLSPEHKQPIIQTIIRGVFIAWTAAIAGTALEDYGQKSGLSPASVDTLIQRTSSTLASPPANVQATIDPLLSRLDTVASQVQQYYNDHQSTFADVYKELQALKQVLYPTPGVTTSTLGVAANRATLGIPEDTPTTTIPRPIAAAGAARVVGTGPGTVPGIRVAPRKS